MPRPFSFNPWALNPWASEPARDAAQAPSLKAVLRPAEELVVRPPPPSPTDPRTELPETTYETDDWYQSMRQRWQPKLPVIQPGLHVSKSMSEEVKAFVNRHVAAGDVPRTTLQCFDYANYQMHVAGFRTGGRPSLDQRSLQILVEYPENGDLVEEVQLDATIEAVLYIKEALHQNIPVLVGICIKTYDPRPNNVKSTPFVEPTNHYVVIVGMDEDKDGVYFEYYDYYFQPEGPESIETRFYLKPTMKLEWLHGGVMVAEVRRTHPL